LLLAAAVTATDVLRGKTFFRESFSAKANKSLNKKCGGRQAAAVISVVNVELMIAT